MIACVQISNFVVSLERQTHNVPADQPIIVRATSAKGSSVLAACPQAARDGVTAGMTLRYAQMLAPDARFVPANPARYRLIQDNVLDLLWLFTDHVETVPIDWSNAHHRRRKRATPQPAPHLTFYLDFGTLRQVDIRTLTTQVQKLLRTQQALEATVGVAQNKFTSFIAAQHARPSQTVFVPQGQEAGFLAAHAITELPMQYDMARRLYLLGIDTLGQFALLSPGAVLAQFGKTGRLLHRLARGLDDSPVVVTPKRLEHRSARSFDDPVSDARSVSVTLGQMTFELVQPLLKTGLACREVRLSLSLANGGSYETLFVLRRPTQSAHHLHSTAIDLFHRVALSQGILGIELILTDLVPGEVQQLSLFSESSSEQAHSRVLQDVAARYGDCLFRVLATDPQARLTEARFCIQSAKPA